MEDTQYNKKEYVILGAGGLGRELESWTSQTLKFNDEYKLQGFIDDNLNALDDLQNNYKVLGRFQEDVILKYHNILLGIADPIAKSVIHNKILADGAEIISFIHESAIIGKNSELGPGHILCPFSLISCNVRIGKSVFLNLGSHIGHDAVIGDFSSIMANVDIGGGAIIGDNVFIGSNATILPGIKIAANSRIGAGSVVLRNIKKSGTYFGNPAKMIY